MIKHTVSYLFPSSPTDVEIEIVCRSEEDAREVYRDRVTNSAYKNVKINTRDFPDDDNIGNRL